MSVYVIAQLRFIDKNRYRRYQSRFAEVFENYSGLLLAADEQPLSLEGDWSGDKVVMMSFPDEHSARRFLNSPAYQEISVDRKAGAETQSLLVHGLN